MYVISNMASCIRYVDEFYVVSVMDDVSCICGCHLSSRDVMCSIVLILLI